MTSAIIDRKRLLPTVFSGTRTVYLSAPEGTVRAALIVIRKALHYMEKIVLLLAKELNIRPAQAEAALQLLDDGNTVPFIARYRKEATGSLDEEQIRNLEARAQYLRNLDTRREEILNSIREQEKLTPELEQQIMAAEKMQVLEDLYLPYRPKKRTRAQIAREKGLEPLASYIVLQADTPKSLSELATPFINAASTAL